MVPLPNDSRPRSTPHGKHLTRAHTPPLRETTPRPHKYPRNPTKAQRVENPTDQPESEASRRRRRPSPKRLAMALAAAFGAIVLAVAAYGVVLFVFQPEDLPGSSRLAAFKCLSRAERAYIRQLRGAAAERRAHLDTVQVYMKQLDEDRQLGRTIQWRQGLSTHMARFTRSSREMAQINGPPSTDDIKDNLTSMSESATSFARQYLQGVRDDNPTFIARSRSSLRDSQLRMLRTQQQGQALCRDN